MLIAKIKTRKKLKMIRGGNDSEITVNVNRVQLIAVLRDNLERHRKDYMER